MPAAGMQSTPEDVRALIQAYFDAWQGTDENSILAFYADDVMLDLPTGTLEGKAEARDHFVRPFLAAFSGNVHAIRNLAVAPNLAAVEWNWEALHSGSFGGIVASGRPVRLTGCSFYEHDLEARKIAAGRIYYDLATLMRQLGA